MWSVVRHQRRKSAPGFGCCEATGVSRLWGLLGGATEE